MRIDWQALVTVAIGLAAALYLARRWWPGLRSLLGGRHANETATACGAPQPPSPDSSCGSGCGNCGHSATAAKDHRVHVVRPKPH